MKKKIYKFTNNLILSDGSYIKENFIKYFKNNQIFFNFLKKNYKKKNK